MPSSVDPTCSMSLTPVPKALSVVYSVFPALEGTIPLADHMELLILVTSPKSVNATMSRLLLVVPVLLVTHISTRLMVIPVVRLGNLDMASSYFPRK